MDTLCLDVNYKPSFWLQFLCPCWIYSWIFDWKEEGHETSAFDKSKCHRKEEKGDNQGHIIPTLHHSTFVLSSVWHWPFCKHYENVFLGDSALTSQICFDLPRGCFIYILDSSNSRSFMIWSRWLASSSRSNWTCIWTGNSNGSWT